SAWAQTSFSTVSMAGIGEIKIGMKKAELEKLVNEPLRLKNLLNKDWERDTLQVTYREMPLQMILDKNIREDKASEIIVYEVKSAAPQLKTRSGIGIGDDKLKIISTYDGYTIHILPEFENNYTVKSKTKSTVWLYGDESDKVTIFYLTNNNGQRL
ncbi:MAG: hypothetical protein ICV51_19240, partial [Flavisolibacter sp.]|nr:hypothetical protein [Flavisolibacter sp.]